MTSRSATQTFSTMANHASRMGALADQLVPKLAAVDDPRLADEAAELAAAAEDVADAYRVKAETLRVGDTTTATAADLEAPRVWFEVAAERLVDVCG